MPQSADEHGAVAVLTGATGGLGREIARGLVRAGMTVVAGSRNPDKGTALAAALSGEPGGGRLEVLPLDLADMESVRRFAAAVTERHASIGLLVNNAGAWFNARQSSPDGHELTFATNALGPYLLTRSLLPQLRRGRPSRVINIVSAATGGYDADDLDWNRRRFNGFKAYTQSKQALRYATWILADQLEGSGVVVNAVSPGFGRTAFLQSETDVVATMLRLLSPFATPPNKAADTPLLVALAPEWAAKTGRYVEGRREKDGGPRVRSDLAELDKRLRERLT